MNDRSSSPPSTVRVWDWAVRVFHWSVAALVTVAYFTADSDETISLHTWAGLAVLGWVLFRIVWGFVGPGPARFRAFVRSPRETLAYARDYVRGRAALHLSHNPLGAVMVVALLTLLLATTLSGLLVYLGPQWDGPLTPLIGSGLADGIEELHEALAGAIPFFVAFHVAGVLLSSRLEGQNLVMAMVTGRKKAPPGAAAVPSMRPLSLVLAAGLGLGVLLGLGVFLPSLADAAETPAGLLGRYEAQAKAEDPGFSGFDPARGRALYFEEHADAGKATSCAACHTADPTAKGKSPAGRNIDPLAPSASPERFTDAKKADKWFRRNCKQILGRDCRATERGDVLAWLLTL